MSELSTIALPSSDSLDFSGVAVERRQFETGSENVQMLTVRQESAGRAIALWRLRLCADTLCTDCQWLEEASLAWRCVVVDQLVHIRGRHASASSATAQSQKRVQTISGSEIARGSTSQLFANRTSYSLCSICQRPVLFQLGRFRRGTVRSCLARF